MTDERSVQDRSCVFTEVDFLHVDVFVKLHGLRSSELLPLGLEQQSRVRSKPPCNHGSDKRNNPSKKSYPLTDCTPKRGIRTDLNVKLFGPDRSAVCAAPSVLADEGIGDPVVIAARIAP